MSIPVERAGWSFEQWLAETRAVRDALAVLGITVPYCLPGEPGDCGAPLSNHYASYLGLLRGRVEVFWESNLDGQEKTLAEGIYADTLIEARRRRDNPRRLPHVMLPVEPYQREQPCAACKGAKVTGERYQMPASEGTPALLFVDVVCPTCTGCGRAVHQGCQPSEHTGWRVDHDFEDDGPEPGCLSCRGRRWNAVRAFPVAAEEPGEATMAEPNPDAEQEPGEDDDADQQILYLRVPCGCAVNLLVEV